jgi:hypothetical protein
MIKMSRSDYGPAYMIRVQENESVGKTAFVRCDVTVVGDTGAWGPPVCQA